MFLIFSGKPGGGKTYRAVNEILKPENQDKFVILHNIDGLKPEKFNCPDLVIDWRVKYIDSGLVSSVEEFFSEDFQTELSKHFMEKHKKPMLIVIDECHRWMQNKNDIMLAWLSFHRHLGQYVVGITQRETMIHHTYRALHQYELRAKLDLFFCFAYAKIENGESCGYSFIRKKKAVFDAYVSYVVESKSYSNKLFFAVVPFVVLGMWFFFQNPFEKDTETGASSPGASSPGASSPGASSPGASSPGASSPGASSAVALTSPDTISRQSVTPKESPGERNDSFFNINDNYVFSGMVSFWSGKVLNLARSKIYLTDKSGECFEYRDIFPRYKFLYMTSGGIAFMDSVKKTPVLFLKGFQPGDGPSGSLGGGGLSPGLKS